MLRALTLGAANANLGPAAEGEIGVVFPTHARPCFWHRKHWGGVAMSVGSYLKKHSEALVKDVGIEAACKLTGKSKATLGRYYSDQDGHDDRFMPIDVVAQLESAARHPYVTTALAELRGITVGYDSDKRNAGSQSVNQDVVALAQRFAQLMAEYNTAISDGKISINEAKRMLRETLAIQQVLLDMKLHLEKDTSEA